MKKTLENFPLLKKEFHYLKNKSFKPKDFAKGSNKKIWWKCSKGHEWQAIINSRTSRATGCPFCGGQKVSKNNNLQFLFPKITEQWHPTKNGKNRPSNFTKGSQKKIWWKCSKGHEWQAIINNRTKGSGCKKCYYIKRSVK